MSRLATAALQLLFVLVVGAASSLLWAYVVGELWGWFVLPTFHLAVPSFVMLLGLDQFSQLVRRTVANHIHTGTRFGRIEQLLTKQDPERLNWAETIRSSLTGLMTTLLAWFFGWLLHQVAS